MRARTLFLTLVCTAGLLVAMTLRPFSLPILGAFATISVLLIVPVTAQVTRGADFVAGRMEMLSEILEMQSPWSMITGDFVHHPCQMARNHWCSTADYDQKVYKLRSNPWTPTAIDDWAQRRGMIGIFNRSHYEDVLIARVHGLAPRKEIDRLRSNN